MLSSTRSAPGHHATRAHAGRRLRSGFGSSPLHRPERLAEVAWRDIVGDVLIGAVADERRIRPMYRRALGGLSADSCKRMRLRHRDLAGDVQPGASGRDDRIAAFEQHAVSDGHGFAVLAIPVTCTSIGCAGVEALVARRNAVRHREAQHMPPCPLIGRSQSRGKSHRGGGVVSSIRQIVKLPSTDQAAASRPFIWSRTIVRPFMAVLRIRGSPRLQQALRFRPQAGPSQRESCLDPRDETRRGLGCHSRRLCPANQPWRDSS